MIFSMSFRHCTRQVGKSDPESAGRTWAIWLQSNRPYREGNIWNIEGHRKEVALLGPLRGRLAI
jgi:hypothetical protein